MTKTRDEGGAGPQEGVRPGPALAAGILLWAGLAAGAWFGSASAGPALRKGLLLGAAFAGAVALAVFAWKYHSLEGSGTKFLAALAGGFLLNLFFLAGGTILARYSALLGDPVGFALGYLGTALICGGTYTWFLRKGEKARIPSRRGRRETEDSWTSPTGGRG